MGTGGGRRRMTGNSIERSKQYEKFVEINNQKRGILQAIAAG